MTAGAAVGSSWYVWCLLAPAVSGRWEAACAHGMPQVHAWGVRKSCSSHSDGKHAESHCGDAWRRGPVENSAFNTSSDNARSSLGAQIERNKKFDTCVSLSKAIST